MLVLSRKVGEVIWIGETIKITVLEIRPDKIRLGITAPKDVPVHREEVWVIIQAELAGEQSAQEPPETGAETPAEPCV